MHESYTQTRLGLRQRLREAWSLYRRHNLAVASQVSSLVGIVKAAETEIERRLGEPLKGKSVLEIGPGQLLKQARYFGAYNKVVAVDLDVVISGWMSRGWWRMLRTNGALRFFKTLARKIAGLDRRFLAELARQVPATAKPNIEFLATNAVHTRLPSDCFDCAVSFSVFEHLPDPRLLIREVNRLLRPGGVSYHIIHLYSSDSGAHDVRSFSVDRSDLPYWAHLRAHTADRVASNSFVNRLTLSDWMRLLQEECPGIQINRIDHGNIPRVAGELRRLRAAGELTDYTDEELTTVCLQVCWVKPSSALAAATPCASPRVTEESLV